MFRKWASGAALVLGLIGTGCGAASVAPASFKPGGPAVSGPTSALDALYQRAKAEGQVVWTGSQQEDIMAPVLAAFKKTYPGIDVSYARAGADVVAKLEVQEAAKHVELDVANIPEINASEVIDHKLQATPDWTTLGIPADRLLEGQVLLFQGVNGVIMYNTKGVAAADAPKSWQDLLNPRWQGKMAIDGKGAFMSVFRDASQLGGDDAGLQFAAKLEAQKPLFQGSNSEVDALVVSGQALLGTDVASNVINALKKGAPVDVAPVSPLHANANFLMVPQGAPHPNAAQLVVAWLSSPEGQSVLDTIGTSLLAPGCDPRPPSVASQFMCDHHLEWTQFKDIAQFRSISDYTDKVQKAFGTYAGSS
jgi:iron(III) transport system substrate-binding protein